MNRRKFLSRLAALPVVGAFFGWAVVTDDAPPEGMWNIAWPEPGRLGRGPWRYQAHPTLLDQIKRTDPDGRCADIVEELSARNPILEDAVVDGKRVTIRSGDR